MPPRGRDDRRVRATKRRLRAALAALVHEKPLEAVAVKEILARADVARSTFYAHFRDKEELLASAIRESLRGGRVGPPPRAVPSDDVLDFSLPLLGHVERHLDGVGPRTTAHGRRALHEHLRHELTALVEERLRRAPRGRASGDDATPPDLLARHVVATFLLVLEWWSERRPRPTAHVADAQFRALVLPALASGVGPPR